MKVYITKYALTEGIQEVADAKVCTSVSYDMIVVPSRGLCSYFHGEGKEWHHTREGAIVKAKQMQEAKIKSLEKSLKKIKALRFECPTPTTASTTTDP